MKKQKNIIYFLVPLVGLVIFGALYWNFSSNYEADLAKKADLEKKAKADKVEARNRDTKKAFDDAMTASANRKKEKEAKEKRDAEQVEARDLAREQLDKATRDAYALTQKIDRLNKEVDATKKDFASIEEDKKKAAKEQEFLRTYVKQAQDNVAALQSVLQKIKEADEAAVKAAAEAAAAAAKAKK